MKKYIIVIMVVVMTLVMTMAISAHSSGAKWGDIPKYNGTITLDGKKDSIYDQAFKVKIDKRTDNITGGATGTAYLLYSDKYVYCYVEVIDKDIFPIDASRVASAFWTNEGIEFTLDYVNDGSNRTKYMAYWDGTTMAAGNAVKDTFSVKGTQSATGWTVEYQCELQNGVKAGSNIGINILIDDMTAKGATRGIIRAPSSLNAGDNDVAKFDYITLSTNEVKIAETTTKAAAAAVTSAVKTDTKAPATADMTAVYFTISFVAISLSGLFAKKHMK